MKKKILYIMVVLIIIIPPLTKLLINVDKINEQKEEINNMIYDNDLSDIDLIVTKSEKIKENLPNYIKEDEIYIKVYLKVTNNSNETFEFSNLRCYAVTSNDEEIKSDALVDLNGLQTVIINPKESIEGFVSFKINKDDNIKIFKYYKDTLSKVPAFEYNINY